MTEEVDLLLLANAAVTAPAGCGKTQLIADALARHRDKKPILVLTHTNAGVAALRSRLGRSGVPANSYKLSTIDGWAIRLVSTFPKRSSVAPDVLRIQNPSRDYQKIRSASTQLLSRRHLDEVLTSSYSRLVVDEYQDCTVSQHEMIKLISRVVPTVILGDPMQAIFGWPGNEPPDWDEIVCSDFPIVAELGTPWRWKNAGTEGFGEWLLNVRRRLLSNQGIDLSTAPPEVVWIQLDGGDDEQKRREAARVSAGCGGNVIVLGDRFPESHRRIASQTPGAVTVDAVDMKDVMAFAEALDFSKPDAVLKLVVEFASSVMTSVGAKELLQRVAALIRGTARNKPTEIEEAALSLYRNPSPQTAVAFLATVSSTPGVHTYRVNILRLVLRALAECNDLTREAFLDIMCRVREQNRQNGRLLSKRCVGSTLLLKGLEAEVAVVLYADDMDAKNLYVAMTRGSHRLIICSRNRILRPRF